MLSKTGFVRGLWTALMIGAASLAVAAPAMKESDGRLVDAAQKKNKEAVVSLLMQGVDPRSTQSDGTTALHWAAHWDDLETADLLLQFGANANALNDFGATPLLLACDNGNAAMVEKLLAKGADPNRTNSAGETPLLRCARTGNSDAVQALIASHADVHARTAEDGQTALMWAVAEKHPAVVEALIRAGADVRARSTRGFTPLLFAARVGDVDSGRLLLQAGAGIDDPTPNGMTPLVLASASGQEAFGIFLLSAGADPNARDAYGATALHYALMKGITALNQIRYANYVAYLFRPDLTELVKALLAHHADPNVAIAKTPDLGGAKDKTVIGATPLILAAAAPDPAVMRLLLAAGADPTRTTAEKMTVLMAAAGLDRGQDFTDDDKRLSLEAVRIAVELAGADVNATNDSGLTAMHGAASNGADGVVEYLVQKGAKLDVRDKYQQTPLSIATGIRLPWIPYGEELGEIIQPTTRDLLLKLGATPVTSPGYFTPPTEYSEAFRINQSQRGEAIPGASPSAETAR